MCGFAGFVHEDRSYPFSESQLLAMRESITHRGPDDAGHYLAPGIGLSSRRLAILDLSERGHMPMSTPDGRFHIAYNGEVYNYRELRAPLESRGHSFRSNTDTEVLLHLYATEGPAMLERLNGMFAFAIWDSRDRTLFLARDRLGVKPLYYAFRDHALYFGSEEKALFAGGVPAEFNPSTWEELLCFRYVAGERTPFSGVKRLLPGHHMIWRDGSIRTTRWWHLGDRARSVRDQRPDDVRRWFQETFDSAVSLRRISDVPVGVLLSGGLDSSSVAVALAMQAGSGVASFTVRFAESQYDEGPLAREVAQKRGLEYHELIVSQEELMRRLQDASWYNDEPLAHASDPHLGAISHYAKPRVTVLLSGEGSDETLGGYVRYRPLRHPALLGAARPFLPALASVFRLNNRLGKLGRFLELGSLERFVLYNAATILPADLLAVGFQPEGQFEFRNNVLSEAKEVYPEDPFRQAMYSDQHTFLCSLLDRNDRMTMGASIECRVPFMDYRLVEGLAALPSSILLAGRNNKQLLRDAIGGRLPTSILQKSKWGFGVPWDRYFRQCPELREIVSSLPDRGFIRDGPFDKVRLKGVVNEFLRGQDRLEPLVRQLVMITIWKDTYFRRLAELTIARQPELQAG